jgi:hypothetical protein
MILAMADRHRDPPLTVRPPAEVLAGAQAVLADRSVEMRAFVSACLSVLAADPDGTLRFLEGHWPPEKPRGRPPRDSSPGSLDVRD